MNIKYDTTPVWTNLIKNLDLIFGVVVHRNFSMEQCQDLKKNINPCILYKTVCKDIAIVCRRWVRMFI